jgi:hypothetical protein
MSLAIGAGPYKYLESPVTVRVIHQQSTADRAYRSGVDNYNEAKLSDVDDSYYYAVGCRSCQRHVRISLVRVHAVLGGDFALIDLIKRLKCTTCGSRKVTVTYLKPSQAVGSLSHLFQQTPL